MSTKPKFALVNWLEDDSVGVMPLSAAKDGEKVYPGATVSLKFQRNYYDAEILKISGKSVKIHAAQYFISACIRHPSMHVVATVTYSYHTLGLLFLQVTKVN